MLVPYLFANEKGLCNVLGYQKAIFGFCPSLVCEQKVSAFNKNFPGKFFVFNLSEKLARCSQTATEQVKFSQFSVDTRCVSPFPSAALTKIAEFKLNLRDTD